MKLKKQDLIKLLIISVIILIIFIVIIFMLGKGKKEEQLDLNKISNNYVIDDSIVMNLYNRYNPERGLLFSLIGSNSNKKYYGYYYKDDIKYDDLDDTVKNTILINDADYKTGKYDEERQCYYMNNDDFGIIYNKLFGKDDYNIIFNGGDGTLIYSDEDKICISEDMMNNEYNKVIDTYMVNAIRVDSYITIYERVAFIKKTDNYLYFYKDINMKDLVYKLKITDKVDISFINNSEIVSNVLLKYQNDFDLYEYKYVEGIDSYYFDSIIK